MKRIIFYTVVLVALVGVILVLLKGKKASTISSDSDFAVEEVDRIYKIFLADKEGNKTLLERQGDQWIVNGEYRAMPSKINLLLKTINRVRVRYPVPKVQYEDVVRDMAANAIKVELYEKGAEKPFKVYYVGDATEDKLGTYMLMEIDGKPAQQPYVTHIRGFEGFLTPRYITRPELWRDRTIFSASIDEIEKVEVEYPVNPAWSFRLINTDDSPVLEPVDSNYRITDREPNRSWILEYLGYFKSLTAEAFVNDSLKRDSIEQTLPYCIVRLKIKNGVKKEMTVYRMPLNRRSKMQYDRQGNPLQFDVDRYYAVFNDGKDFGVIQEYVFGKVFRRYEEFFPGESS